MNYIFKLFHYLFVQIGDFQIFVILSILVIIYHVNIDLVREKIKNQQEQYLKDMQELSYKQIIIQALKLHYLLTYKFLGVSLFIGFIFMILMMFIIIIFIVIALIGAMIVNLMLYLSLFYMILIICGLRILYEIKAITSYPWAKKHIKYFYDAIIQGPNLDYLGIYEQIWAGNLSIAKKKPQFYRFRLFSIIILSLLALLFWINNSFQIVMYINLAPFNNGAGFSNVEILKTSYLLSCIFFYYISKLIEKLNYLSYYKQPEDVYMRLTTKKDVLKKKVPFKSNKKHKINEKIPWRPNKKVGKGLYTKIKNKLSFGTEDKCLICYNQFLLDDEVATCISCNRHFHSNELTIYLRNEKQMNQTPNCPVCRITAKIAFPMEKY
ncbi:MAG: E3 ubiquitin protein ligase [Candidatus Heimdallarchaeota archaeon]|nr:E3 ubiquitin protein ligase [Candidatus Heimdallarchaeota archaeon]